MGHRIASLMLSIAVVGAALAGAPAHSASAAQDSAPAQPARKGRGFDETARVVAVEVPVNVVDKNGTPVPGLTAEDFEIYDEGKLQRLTDFEVIDLASVEGLPSPVERHFPSSSRRHFLLLFDISFSNPSAVLKARVAARDFVLQQMHPTDLVAVATYSLETGPRLVVTFTPDRAQVAQAIDSLGLFRSTELDPLRFLIEPTRLPGHDSSQAVNSTNPDIRGDRSAAVREHMAILAEQLDKSERSFKRSQITSFSRSLGEMARKMSAIDGRKQIVLFSEGFDSRLLTGTPLADISSGDQRQLQIQRGEMYRVDADDVYGNTELQSRLSEMVQEFRRADCVIQAVDIGGLRAGGSAREGGPINSGQEGLFYMAHETGGELFKDANNLESQLERVLERSSVTYLLTFTPSELATSGEFRRLRVKLKENRLKEKGAGDDRRLSYRQGYYAPRPFSELDPLEKELLASEAIATAAPAADFGLDVLAAAFRATRDWAYVPVIVEVDGKSLLAGHGQNALPVEIYVYVTDGKGEMKGFFTQQVKLDISRGRELLTGKGLKYYGHLELAPGDYLVRVLVRNATSGRAAVKAVPLSVPSFEQQETVMLPPFFLEEPGRWLLVRERQDIRAGSSTVYPFTINGQPYVPAVRPEIGRDEDANFCLVAYNLSDGAVTLDGEVVNSVGETMAGGRLELVERTATGILGLDKLLARFAPSGLAAGHYTLKVALVDPATGRSLSNSIPFSVPN